MSEEKKLTTASGIPYYHHEDTRSAGARGALLLQDFILRGFLIKSGSKPAYCCAAPPLRVKEDRPTQKGILVVSP